MREESCTFSFRQRWEKAKTGDAASRMALSICETDNITVITFCNYAVMVKCKSIVMAECNYFATTDDRLLKYQSEKIELVTPGEFIRRMEADE